MKHAVTFEVRQDGIIVNFPGDRVFCPDDCVAQLLGGFIKVLRNRQTTERGEAIG